FPSLRVLNQFYVLRNAESIRGAAGNCCIAEVFAAPGRPLPDVRIPDRHTSRAERKALTGL
ncbi:hypothetical protein, partial [Pseudomonas canadensis]|uniref:hypothetical protein n=1 Tax=Pseudomonas canadensis TaxID=915099 RepID=UPI0030DD9F13